MDKTPKRKVYYPPGPEDIEEAASLLRQMLDRDTEFEDGFSSLLKAIAKAYANNLSREDQAQAGHLDNDHQTA